MKSPSPRAAERSSLTACIMTIRRLTAILALAVLASCTKAGTRTFSNDSLTISIPIAPTTLNPILANTTMEAFFGDLMFPKLIGVNPQHQHIPWLATEVPSVQNGGISADGKTITYHLRTNAKWSDGVQVTSEDVKFSYEAMMNSKNNVTSRHGFDMVASIDTPDAHTVVVHLKKIFPPFLDAFFGESDSPVAILPAHVLSKYPNLNQVPFDSEPSVSCGPYKFGEWVRGDHITLVANPDYYLGAPKIAKLVVKPISDTNTAVAQMRTGEVQMILEITGPQSHEMQGDKNIAQIAVDSPEYDAVMLNTQRAPLNDRQVRLALSYATDRARLVRDEQFGQATVGVGDLSPFYWAFDPALHAPPYDPAKAKQILEADGWSPGPDGIMRKNGKKLSLLFVYGQGSDIARNVVVEVQQMWKNAGVELQAKTFPYAQLLAGAGEGGIIYGGKYDAALYAWQSGVDPDDSTQWMSSAIPPAGNNAARYVSAAMDAAQKQALSTYDQTKRKAAYAKIEKLLVDDVPAVFIYYRKERYAYAPSLQNFHPNGVDEAWNAQDWTFASSR